MKIKCSCFDTVEDFQGCNNYAVHIRVEINGKTEWPDSDPDSEDYAPIPGTEKPLHLCDPCYDRLLGYIGKARTYIKARTEGKPVPSSN